MLCLLPSLFAVTISLMLLLRLRRRISHVVLRKKKFVGGLSPRVHNKLKEESMYHTLYH